MGQPDLAVMSSRAVHVAGNKFGERHDLWVRGFLARNKGWPFTSAPDPRPSSPALWAIHCDVLPTIAGTVTTAGDYVIHDGSAWVDITAAVLSAAIVSKGGGTSAAAITAAVTAHNAAVSLHPTYLAQTAEPTTKPLGLLWKNTSGSTVATVPAGATRMWDGSAWVVDPAASDGITLYTEATTAPTSPKAGQRWKNTSGGTVSGIAAGATGYWTGTAWMQEGVSSVVLYTEATTAPTTPAAGQRWKNTSGGAVSGVPAGRTAYYTGAAWEVETNVKTIYSESTAAPTSPIAGERWKNTNTVTVSGVPAGQTAYWTGATWSVDPVQGALYVEQATAPTNLFIGLRWKNTSGSTVSGISAGRVGYYSGAAFVEEAAGVVMYSEATSAPTSPLAGQRWKNTSGGTVSGVQSGATAYWSGTVWITTFDLAYTEASSIPSSPLPGERWKNTSGGSISGVGSGETAYWTGAVWVVEGSNLPAGTIVYGPWRSAPAGFLKANGATAVSRATFPALWTASHVTATVTITIASPGVVSWTAHSLNAGDPVRFYTTGVLPTGITANTTYYVSATGLATNSFSISATVGGATINTTGSQSGAQTAVCAPNGFGDGFTTFGVIELRGEFVRGWDDGRGIDTGRGLGSAQADDFKAHVHTVPAYGNSGTSGGRAGPGTGATPTILSDSSGGAETRPRNIAYLACVKY